MPRKEPASDEVRCSFCGKTQSQVAKLVAGPDAYICNECVQLCVDIIEEETGEPMNGQSSPEPKEPKDDIATLRAMGRRLRGMSEEVATVVRKLEAKRFLEGDD